MSRKGKCTGLYQKICWGGFLEKIADFLRVVGASNALLEFENVRIIKSMRNDVNRQVNCETANLAKTIDAAVRQTNLIKLLLEQEGWEGIPSQYV